MQANESIHSRIRRLRAERGMSLSKLEHLSGINKVHISNIESGKRRPSAQSVGPLAKGLGVEPEYLIEVCNWDLRDYDVEARYWHDVDERAEDECWPWTGRIGHHGYPRMWVNYREVRAARFGYKLLVGDIPDGMTIDHTCNNAGCMNPKHWQLVTGAENSRLRWEREKG